MSDDALRALQRQDAAGEPVAQRYRAALVRAGHPDPMADLATVLAQLARNRAVWRRAMVEHFDACTTCHLRPGVMTRLTLDSCRDATPLADLAIEEDAADANRTTGPFYESWLVEQLLASQLRKTACPPIQADAPIPTTWAGRSHA